MNFSLTLASEMFPVQSEYGRNKYKPLQRTKGKLVKLFTPCFETISQCQLMPHLSH